MKFYTNVFNGRKELKWTGYDNGKRFISTCKFTPKLYITEGTGYKGCDDEDLCCEEFSSLYDYYNFIKENGRENVYGNINPIYQFIHEEFGTNDIKVDKSLIRIFIIDIEILAKDFFPDVNKAEYPINLITIKDVKDNMIYCLSTVDFSLEKMELDIDKNKFKYIHFDNENEMLTALIYLFKKLNPDILTGWNVDGFDMPYIYNRIANIFGETALIKMSQFNEVTKVHNKYLDVSYLDIGIPILDCLNLYKKFVYKTQESYSLSSISKYEIGEGKIEYKGSLFDFCTSDPQKYVEYNIQDVILVDKINEKLHLTDLALTIAYKAKVNYTDIFSSMRMWDVMIYYRLKELGYEILPEKINIKQDYPGAFVMEPEKGIHKYIVSYDVNSLYPNIIIACNLSFETRVKKNNLEKIIDLDRDRKKQEQDRDNYRKTLEQDNLKATIFSVIEKNNDVASFIISEENKLRLNVDDNEINKMIDKGYAIRNEYNNNLIEFVVLPDESLQSYLDEQKERRKKSHEEKEDSIQKAIDFIMKREENYGDVTITPNMELWYHDEQGFIPGIMEKIYNDRVSVKKKMKGLSGNERISLNLEQEALKILLNSGYGLFGNEYFRYFSPEIAAAVTTTGQLILYCLKEAINSKLGKYAEVIYGDTDSLYISVDDLVKSVGMDYDKDKIISLVENFSTKYIEPVINETFGIIDKKMNLFKNTFSMKREKIADVGLFVAKKKYVVRKVVDGDRRLDMPDLDITGLEIIRTSTPQIIRDKLRNMLDLIMDGMFDKLKEEIYVYKKEYMKFPVDVISFPRSINDLEKYADDERIYKKGTPIHVRGALLYNKLLKDFNLESRYKKLYSKAKLKFVYLKMPNPIGENIISFVDVLPVEFGLNSYIDYDLQFEKTFLSPLQTFLDVCDVNIMKKDECVSMSQFFD